MTFTSSWWLIPLWLGLFLLDNYLTVLVARRYDTQEHRVIEFEGGYELTPQYKEEIAQHKLLGPAFLRSLVIFTSMFVVIRLLVRMAWLPVALFELSIGGAVLLSCAVNVRHAQNLVFFGLIPVPEPPSGSIRYPSTFSYRGSAIGFFVFGLLYLLLSGIFLSWFIFGGAIACMLIAFSHWRLSNRPRQTKGSES
jgi:hypothetical protein